jgi:hypothetical protein
MTRTVGQILLFASLVCSVAAWGIHPSDRRPPSRLHASAESGKNSMILQRRDLFLAVGGIAAVGAGLVPGAAHAEEDPFAEMDAIAKKIKDSSNYPNSISPLPTYKATEKDLVSGSDDAQPKSDAKSSDMAKVLEDIQKQKRIGPRTHG